MAHPDPKDESTHNEHRHAVLASEAKGLLLIAAVLLILTVVRYWRHIHWSWR